MQDGENSNNVNLEESSFESAYDGKATETPPTTQEQQQNSAAPAQQSAQKTLEERFAALEKSHDTLSGTFGGIKRDLQSLLATSKEAASKVSDAPTQQQVQQAANNPQKWQILQQQHPDWAAALQEGMTERLSKERGELFTEARKAARIDYKLDAIVSNGDWQQVVTSDEYKQWISAQAPEFQALEQSDSIADAEKLLRAYEYFQKQKGKTATTPQQPSPQAQTRQKRIEASLQPRGSGAPISSSINDEEAAFEAAYKS